MNIEASVLMNDKDEFNNIVTTQLDKLRLLGNDTQNTLIDIVDTTGEYKNIEGSKVLYNGLTHESLLMVDAVSKELRISLPQWYRGGVSIEAKCEGAKIELFAETMMNTIDITLGNHAFREVNLEVSAQSNVNLLIDTDVENYLNLSVKGMSAVVYNSVKFYNRNGNYASLDKINSPFKSIRLRNATILTKAVSLDMYRVVIQIKDKDNFKKYMKYIIETFKCNNVTIEGF